MDRIAVLPGRNADRAMLRRLRALVSFLSENVLSTWEELELVVGLPLSATYDWDRAAGALCAEGTRVRVRRLVWHDVEMVYAQRMYQHCGRQIAPDTVQSVAVPRDWGWNFGDCAHWLVIPDTSLGAVVNIRPTIVYCRDTSVRYVPELVANSIQDQAWKRLEEAYLSWRLVEAMLVTDPNTAADLNGFAGIRREAIAELPCIWGRYPPQDVAATRERDGAELLWLADRSPRHDLDHDLLCLAHFLEKKPQARVLIAGEAGNALSRAALVEKAAGLELDLGTAEWERVRFRTIRDEEALYEAISHSRVVWSGALAEGEPEYAVISSRLGKPYVGVDFPQLRRVLEAEDNAEFLYSPGEPRLTASTLLHASETAKMVAGARSFAEPYVAQLYVELFRRAFNLP